MQPLNRLAAAWLALAPLAAAAEDLSFDLSAYAAPSPFELHGQVELRQEHQRLDADSALYRLNFGDGTRRTLDRNVLALELTGSHRRGDTRLTGTWRGEHRHDLQGDQLSSRFHELYLAHRAGPARAFEIGKRALKWGKGYAWNPVGFVERPKDPNDPELSREGYVIAGADFIHSGAGPFRTLAFTPLLLPVENGVNDDFGDDEALNAAARLYLLYRDVDIDLYWLGGGSRPDRFGLDFSTNLAPQFEIHGEYARIAGHVRQRLAPDGLGLETQRDTAHAWLLGLRYLTERETTWIVEYYHDDRGYTREEMADFLKRLRDADEAALPFLRQAGRAGYARPSAMRDYLYLRVAQKDAMDILYVNPALTLIRNLNDDSWSLSPELLYTGIDDLELRLRATWLEGGELSEFGARANDHRLELRLRYSF